MDGLGNPLRKKSDQKYKNGKSQSQNVACQQQNTSDKSKFFKHHVLTQL